MKKGNGFLRGLHKFLSGNSKQKTGNCFLSRFRTSALLRFRSIALLFAVAVFLFTALPAWAGINQWTSNGPYGGLMRSLAVSPNYATDQTVFAGTNYNGVFKSTDGGTNWEAVNDGINSHYIPALAMSPNYSSDQTVFAGGTYHIYRSTDGGNTWTAVNIATPDVRGIVVSPNYAIDQTVYAAGYNGIFKSTDGGLNYTAVNASITNALALSPNYAIDQTVYAGSGGSGIFKSTDSGASWSAVNTGLTNLFISSLSVSPDYANDRTVYAGMGGGGVFKSTDGGANWTPVNTGLFLNIEALTISPNYATDQTVFAGTGIGVYKSINGGASWTHVSSGPLNMGDTNALVVSSNYAADQTIFAGTWSGVYKSTDSGANWSWASDGILSTYSDVIAVSPTYATDQAVFTGTQWSGVFKSTDRGLNWSRANNGLPKLNGMNALAISPNYATDNTVFAGIACSGIFKSTDSGANWSAANTGIPLGTCLRSLSLSPDYTTDQTVFAGTGSGVFKSTDGGANWTAVNTGLTTTAIYVIAMSPNYSADPTVFAGTGSGVFKSIDGGGNWADVNTGITNTDIRALAISPNYAVDQTVYAGTQGGGVFKSEDGAASWTAANSGYTCNIVLALAISPDYESDRTIYKGTAGGCGGGVLKSTDGGTNWISMSTGLSNHSTYALALPPNYTLDHTIFAGIEGSGVFAYTFPAVNLPRTGQTTSYAAGDDGAIQAGVAWPNPRFTDNGDGTVTDNLTGLQWLKDANCINTMYPSFDSDQIAGDGAVTWQHALDLVKGIDAGTYPNCGVGHTDWRLPNAKELRSLVDYAQYNPSLPVGHPFLNVQPKYWTSSTGIYDPLYSFYVSMSSGILYADTKYLYFPQSASTYFYYVWPVRTGQLSSQPVQLPKTGQTTCYDASGNIIVCAGTGQDGELQMGVAWPNPRFTDSGNGTIADNLTGLTWLKNANCFGTQTWSQAITAANNLANGQCGLTDSSHAGNWRLPNINEIESLINAGQSNVGTWLNSQGFSNVQSMPGYYYWSSTTYANNPNYAWFAGLGGTGVISYSGWDNSYIGVYTWPVRGGTVATPTDTTPDPFTFTDQTGVALSILITSNSITVSGIDAPSPISITGGEYSINGGAFTSVAGTVNNGDSVQVR